MNYLCKGCEKKLTPMFVLFELRILTYEVSTFIHVKYCEVEPSQNIPPCYVEDIPSLWSGYKSSHSGNSCPIVSPALVEVAGQHV